MTQKEREWYHPDYFLVLRKLHLLKKFHANAKEHCVRKKLPFNEFIVKISKMQNSEAFIASGFIWRETPEGFDYWSAKHQLFNKVLRKLKK